MRQVYDNQTIANTSNGDNTTRSAHQHMGHTTVWLTTNPGWTHGLVSSLAKPLPHTCFFGKTKAATHQERLHGTANPDTTDITSGHNPGAQSHTSTSGPLIRRRVTIHVEDHKPPEPIGRHPTYKTTPQPQRLTTTATHLRVYTLS